MGMAWSYQRPTTFFWCGRCGASGSALTDKEDDWQCDCPAWRNRLDAILWLPIRLELWWQDKLIALLRGYADWLEWGF